MSSFLERMKSKMSGSLNRPLFERIRPKDKVRQTVITNRWDERVWQAARKTEPIDTLITDLYLGDEHKGGTRKGFEPSPELVRDLYMAFFKAAPRLEDQRSLERDVYAVRKIMAEILESPKLQELQAMTAGDPIMSTVALDAMAGNVREIMARIPPPPPPPQPVAKPQQKHRPKKQDGEEEPGDGGEGQPAEQSGEDQPGEQPVEGQGQAGAGEPDGDPTEGEGDGGDGEEDLTEDADTDEFDPDAELAEEQAELDWEAAYDEALAELDLERAMSKALDAANQEASDLDNLRRGIGLEDGEWASMSPEERWALADRLRTPEMKELAETIGRMKRFALGVKATRIIDVMHEAYDVETGNRIQDVLGCEFALLSTPETKYEFYRKYSDKELLQFKKRGTEEVGKGPIVICIDKSGSMNGKPFNWAMAVAEALRRFAADEDRDYYAMFFGSNNDRNRFEFLKGKGPFEKVLAFLSCIANGGTQFDGVLTEALDKATTAFDGEGRGKADIVFVTDGRANLSEEWIAGFNAEKVRTGVRMFSVYIGGARDMAYHSGPLELLAKISDVTIPVTELRPESAKQIFTHV
jgi:uncharacterized protein with von Willebrand factor type A (vWA) domain